MNHVPKNALRIDGSHAAKLAPFDRPVWYLTRRGIIVMSACQEMVDGKLLPRPTGKRKIVAKLGQYRQRPKATRRVTIPAFATGETA